MSKTSSFDSLIAFGKVSFIFIKLSHKLLSKDTQLTIGSFTGDEAWLEDLCNAVLNASFAHAQSTHSTRPPMTTVFDYSWAYTTLDVSESATEPEIKSAFKSLVKQYHPDINKAPEATQKYIDVVKAYQILSAV